MIDNQFLEISLKPLPFIRYFSNAGGRENITFFGSSHEQLESVEYLKILRSKSSQDLAIYMYRRWINVDVPPFIDPH